MKDYYKLSVDETLNELNADSAGLSSERAAERLAQYGPNKLKEAEKPGFRKRFLTQMKDPMLIILLAAAGVSALTGAIAGESEWAETIIILAVVLLNAVLGVLQESKAEAAIEALQTMTAATCKVLRDGKMAVLHSDELVPGDVVLLEAGDAVPADGRIIESASLKIEEAALTGESVPVNKMLDALGAAQKKADVPQAKPVARKPKSVKPIPTVTYALEGEFSANDASKALLKKVNDKRTQINAQLLDGEILFFSGRGGCIPCGRLTEAFLGDLVAFQKECSSEEDFVSRIRSAGYIMLSNPMCKALYRNRVDYLKLQNRLKRLQDDTTLRKKMNEMDGRSRL